GARAHPFDYHLDAARTHHPFEAMVAVLALELTRREHLRQLLEVALELPRRIQRLLDALALAHAFQPRPELGARLWPEAPYDRPVHVWEHAQVAPSEVGAVEVGVGSQLAFEA